MGRYPVTPVEFWMAYQARKIMKTIRIQLSLFATLSALSLGLNGLQAQSAVVTYQGLVTDNGTNFNGAGQFQFALVTSTNANQTATATANAPSGGYITGYTVTFGGSGYVSPPAVTVSGGGGTGATAAAAVGGGAVTNVSVTSTGNGNYTGAPTVTIAAPPADIVYTTYWSNDGTSQNGSEPAAAVSVAVSNGLFTVALGDTTLANMTALDTSLFTQTNLQLRIWFNDGVNGFAALNPAQNLTPAPYAIIAQNAGNLLGTVPAAQVSGVLGNAQLANNSVTVNAGTGLSGGGAVALGASTTLNNAGVLSVTGNADITASTAGGVVTLASSATNINTTNTIVKRDSAGNFSAGTITLAGTLNMANPEENTAVGSGALGSNTTGAANTASGWEALYYNTSGSNNTANGWEALYYNTTGSENTADGFYALYNNSSAYQNTAGGAYALYYNTTGSDNTANGWVALLSNTSGSNNTAGGAFALFDNSTGGYNTASGVSALYYNTSGSSNTANGYQALYSNTAGAGNTATGALALSASMTGNYNTADGYDALLQNTAGNNNIALGYGAGSNLYAGNNNIDIGNAGVVGDNNTIRIGSGQTSTFVAGISGVTLASGAPVYASSSGQLGTVNSSRRFKQDIQSMGQASDLLLALRPVTFRYKPELDPKGAPQFGLIAEEVNQVDPDLVLRDEKNQIYTVRYDAVNAMLLNEFLKEHRKVEAQDGEIQDLKKRLEKLERLINAKTEQRPCDPNLPRHQFDLVP
jgi:hypothetical protein